MIIRLLLQVNYLLIMIFYLGILVAQAVFLRNVQQRFKVHDCGILMGQWRVEILGESNSTSCFGGGIKWDALRETGPNCDKSA